MSDKFDEQQKWIARFMVVRAAVVDIIANGMDRAPDRMAALAQYRSMRVPIKPDPSAEDLAYAAAWDELLALVETSLKAMTREDSGGSSRH